MEKTQKSKEREGGVRIGGLCYFDGTLGEAITTVLPYALAHTPFAVFTPGATVAACALRDKDLLSVLSRGDLLLPDGKGICLAARIVGEGRVDRIAGIDFAEALLAVSAPYRIRVFLYGGKAGVAERATARLREKYPHLLLSSADGYGADPSERIARFRPHVVAVCLGAGKQEAWILKNKDRIGGLHIGLGGSLDVWAGDKRRAPRLLRRVGLEWAWRTLLEPRRIFRLLPLPRYFLYCLSVRQSAKKRDEK